MIDPQFLQGRRVPILAVYNGLQIPNAALTHVDTKESIPDGKHYALKRIVRFPFARNIHAS